MARLEASIAGAGFETRNLTYRSRCCSIREAAEEVSAQLGDLRIEHPLIGVTHSMGGVVMRALASRFNWGGCVMLGPPNHASGLAASTSRMRLFRWLMGPACIELGQELRWPDPPRPCGIIVGTAGMTLDNPPSWLAGLRGVFDRACGRFAYSPDGSSRDHRIGPQVFGDWWFRNGRNGTHNGRRHCPG
jgi:hypothetical protein